MGIGRFFNKLTCGLFCAADNQQTSIPTLPFDLPAYNKRARHIIENCKVYYHHPPNCHHQPQPQPQPADLGQNADQVWLLTSDSLPELTTNRVRTLTGKEIELDIEPEFKVCLHVLYERSRIFMDVFAGLADQGKG